MPFCTSCSKSVPNKSWIGHLRSKTHKDNESSILLSPGVEKIASAFKSRIVSYRIAATDETTAEMFLNSIRDKVRNLINESLKKHTCIKINFELFSIFFMFKNNTQEIKSFSTKNVSIYFNYDFKSFFSSIVNTLINKSQEFEERDSGWTFLCCSHLELNVNKYVPLRGSTFIELPRTLKNKKACINIRNSDQYCFLWSVVASLYPAKSHCDRISSYPHFQDVLKTDGMSFPITFYDIKIFEKNNSHLSFIIYGVKNSKTLIGPLYKSKNHNNKKTIHLLFLEDGNKSHYCLIKDLSRLVRSQITAHHGKLYFCDTCLIFFKSESQLNTHICGGIITKLPVKGSIIKFKNYDRKQNVPIVIYADFETMLEKCENDLQSAHTLTLQKHVAVAFAYHIVCSADSSFNRYVSYRGVDCVDKFIENIYEDAHTIYEMLSLNTPIVFSQKEAKDFNNAIFCHICNNLLFGDKVRDHCHISGKYRGAAHNYCNLQYKVIKFVPIFFHNLGGYDCHLFIKKLGEAPGSIKIIPKTREKYISFTKFIPINEDFMQLRFVDSFKFLGISLDNLTKTMKRDDFHYISHYFPNQSLFNLLTRKGVYPYEYMNCWERYNEQALPSQQQFYSSLTDNYITDDEYSHAQTVWLKFNIQNLGEYTDLYLKTDVLLLTDIFENFRKTCKNHYDLDPAFYLTAPSLSFDAMLYKTGVELELIEDLEIIRMIQSGIRGGVCMCSHRHVKANNQFTSRYDPNAPNSFIVYIDCNNLYGYSMCQSLPSSNFRFLTKSEIDKFDLHLISDNSSDGYILEVDLSYPKKLHDSHNDLPFCPEKCIPPGGKNFKLVPNLHDKYFYVIHYVHLKTCLKHGLILKKIHRVITFKQSPYLKQYIDLNTTLRKLSNTTFEQDFFKLLNNSIFGKTLENNEKRINVHLVNQWRDDRNKTKKRNSADKMIARPNFHSSTILTENLVAIQLKPDCVILNKPIYIGFTVLELSKAHMYDFHYSVFQPFYDTHIKMCYTDTDSFIYHIQTQNFYRDLKLHFLKYFDTSNYSIDNGHGLPIHNKKVPGLFKDEMGGTLINEFVGLRSKLYCLKTSDRVIKRAKGIKTCVVQTFSVADYKKTLLEDKIVRKTNILFKSIKHEIFTSSVDKVALSANDDKRAILKDKVSTKAWGHVSILGV